MELLIFHGAMEAWMFRNFFFTAQLCKESRDECKCWLYLGNSPAWNTASQCSFRVCDSGLEAEGERVVPAHQDLACLIARRLICEQLLAPTSGHTTGEERWGWKSQSEKTQQSQSYYLRVIYLFLMWTILKIFIEFVAILFPFYVLILGWEACGILATWPGWLQD